MAGHIQAGFFDLVATPPFVESGGVRGINSTGSNRSDRLPKVPYAAEVGITGMKENAGYLMMVLSATPADIIVPLHREIIRTLGAPEVKSRLAVAGSAVIGS